MAQNDIGIDLGTTTIIIAQAGQGVVLNQPSVVAMDTRKNSVLEVGDKALAMVGRTPNYISAIFPLKDGVISDHTMTRELICRFVNQVYSSHMVKPRVAVCVPAAITGIESDAVVEAVMAAGARQVYNQYFHRSYSFIFTCPSSTVTFPFAIRSIARGMMTHSASSMTRCCSAFGVSPSCTSTAFCRIIGPVSVPPSTK